MRCISALTFETIIVGPRFLSSSLITLSIPNAMQLIPLRGLALPFSLADALGGVTLFLLRLDR